MKCLFRQRISSFAALASLMTLVAMLVVFCVFIPEFIVSVAGRVFAVIWAVLAIGAFIVHTRNVVEPSYKPLALPVINKKSVHRMRNTKQRMLRGM